MPGFEEEPKQGGITEQVQELIVRVRTLPRNQLAFEQSYLPQNSDSLTADERELAFLKATQAIPRIEGVEKTYSSRAVDERILELEKKLK
jgi:hypothetical protein